MQVFAILIFLLFFLFRIAIIVFLANLIIKFFQKKVLTEDITSPKDLKKQIDGKKKKPKTKIAIEPELEEESGKEKKSFEEALKKYGETNPSDNKIDTETQNYKLEITPSLKEQLYNQEKETYSDNKTNTESFDILKAEENNKDEEETLKEEKLEDKDTSKGLSIARIENIPKIELDKDNNEV